VLQEVLSTGDEYVVPDGVFGPRTEAAVRASQTALGLDPTGLVDAATWGQLVASYPGSAWIMQLNDPVLIEPDGSARQLPVLASAATTPITRGVTRPLITLWSVESP
jgi:hypothetical protein